MQCCTRVVVQILHDEIKHGRARHACGRGSPCGPHQPIAGRLCVAAVRQPIPRRLSLPVAGHGAFVAANTPLAGERPTLTWKDSTRRAGPDGPPFRPFPLSLAEEGGGVAPCRVRTARHRRARPSLPVFFFVVGGGGGSVPAGAFHRGRCPLLCSALSPRLCRRSHAAPPRLLFAPFPLFLSAAFALCATPLP